MKVDVREAGEADLNILATMNKHLIEDERHENAMTIAELEVRMHTWLTTGYEAYVFSFGGEVIGYALINRAENPPYLRQFFIVRHRRRSGLGREAFIALKRIANLDQMDLDVLVWNEAATSFWQALGFKARSTRMQFRES